MLKPGDVGVLRASAEPHWVIKRLAALPGDPVPEPIHAVAGSASTVPPGMLVVLADNPSAIDSRDWGFVRVDGLLGSVIRKFPALFGRTHTASNRAGLSGVTTS
jgi:hypothetical protein